MDGFLSFTRFYCIAHNAYAKKRFLLQQDMIF
jgi:hypothetical protein